MQCRNCGQPNEAGQSYCRFCGAALAQPQPETVKPPKPYSWASDSSSLHNVVPDPFPPFAASAQPPPQVQPVYAPPAGPSSAPQPQMQTAGYRCPRCGTHALPVTQSKMSDAGLIVLILMIFFCLPLFWIGFLMREQYRVCPICSARLS